MNKVAICFSGLPRLHSKEATQAWQSWISKFNADVFVHFWNINPDTLVYQYNQIQKLFSPKIIKFDVSRPYPYKEYSERVWPNLNQYNVFSAFDSVHESQNLVEKYSGAMQFKYEYVIRARFDVIAHSIDLKPVSGVAVPDDKTKLILKFAYKDKKLWGVADLLAFGSQDNMSLYCNTIKHISFLYHNEHVDFCSEIFLTANLVRQNVEINFEQLPYTLVKDV